MSHLVDILEADVTGFWVELPNHEYKTVGKNCKEEVCSPFEAVDEDGRQHDNSEVPLLIDKQMPRNQTHRAVQHSAEA